MNEIVADSHSMSCLALSTLSLWPFFICCKTWVSYCCYGLLSIAALSLLPNHVHNDLMDGCNIIGLAMLWFDLICSPCRLNDLVGSDIGLHVGKNFLDSFPERVYISSLIPLMNQHKRLGEKTGKGFYKVGTRSSHCACSSMLGYLHILHWSMFHVY
jgi:hypothetical protein